MTRRKNRGAATGDPAAGQGSGVKLKDVAEYLDLSTATVSLVLNRSPRAEAIPEATQKRVFEAARKLQYRPNYLAKSLRNQRSYSIGVVVPEISEGYAAGVMSGVESHLLDAGYFYLVVSHRSKPDLLKEYVSLLKERLVEGFLLVNTPVEESPGLPTVAVAGNRPLAGVTNVVIDHDRAAHLALSHLAELGHERIAFFKGHPGSADTEGRWQAILTAADALGLAVEPELTVQLSGDRKKAFSPQEGYREGYAFGQELLAGQRKFTALFAFNDVSAIGAMRAFSDAGLRIPQDVSLVGFDDIQSAAFQNPSLTTVRQPLADMGEIAARTLLERLNGTGPEEKDHPTTHITVEPELVVRDSSGKAVTR